MKIIPVILSGGNGTRLWPLSRKQYPKQYLSLVEEQTMLQATIQRLDGLEYVAEPLIICNAEHRFLVAEQLKQIQVNNPTILLESVGKNTAPAIASAAHYVTDNLSGENDILLILSADHVIEDAEKFHQAIKVAMEQAESGKLVTFGVMPTSPQAGYGYIQTKASYNGESAVLKVESFHEKPSQETANDYLKTDNFLWNSGMFMFQTKIVLDELNIHSPIIVEAAKDVIDKAEQDLDFVRMGVFSSQLPADNTRLSIDYALMEKTDNTVVVPLDAGWSDVGSWKALYEIGNKDDNKNVIVGDVIAQETYDSYINANHHMVATIGVDNLIIVDTPDAILVAAKEKSQQVKSIVELLQKRKRCEEQIHRKVYRPWGWYDTIDKESRFQVKRICVNPGACLSLQKHYHRAEHWIIVKGIAKITNDDKIELLGENQSTYIPVGALHRLENPGKLPLEMIEVQSGSYLEEDDIERFEDSYGRKKALLKKISTSPF